MRKRPKHEPIESYFIYKYSFAKCMVRSDAFNLHVDPVRTEINDTQNIHISHICSLDEIKSKGIIADKNLSQVFSTASVHGNLKG